MKDKSGKRDWVLRCVSAATSLMDRDDWYGTSMSTNIAESAHALSQRDGIHLSLVAAIQAGKKIDDRFLEVKAAAVNTGIMSRSGNQSGAGRAERNLKRSQKAAEKRKGKSTVKEVNKEDESDAMKTLRMAQDLIKEGVPAATIDAFLKNFAGK
jgi:hypothetical protein